VTLAGALALALAVTALGLAPVARIALPRPRAAHPDAGALGEAGWSRPLWQWEGVRAASAAALAALSLAVGVLPIVGLAVGAALPSFATRLRADDTRRSARRARARLLRATEGAMRSGTALPEALRRACDGIDDALARRPFVAALRAFDLGGALDASLRDAARGDRDARARAALETVALGVAARLSTDRAAQLVAAVADRLAFDERLDEEVRSRTGGLRFQVLLLAAIVPCLAAYLSLTVPTLALTLGSPLGRTVLIPAAVVLELAGIVLSRRAVADVVR